MVVIHRRGMVRLRLGLTGNGWQRAFSHTSRARLVDACSVCRAWGGLKVGAGGSPVVCQHNCVRGILRVCETPSLDRSFAGVRVAALRLCSPSSSHALQKVRPRVHTPYFHIALLWCFDIECAHSNGACGVAR